MNRTSSYIVQTLIGAALVSTAGFLPIRSIEAQPPDRGRFSRGGFDPSFILRRMDRNGNGMLEPEEVEGRGAEFLSRITGGRLTRLPRAVSIDQAAEWIRRIRERSEGSGGDSSRRDRGSWGSRGGATSPEIEPLVPGFDLVEAEPVLGFGPEAEAFSDLKITEEDEREAERVLARYDRNRDKILDAEEIRRGRWSEPASTTDVNKDGKLTKRELALRYARRREARGDRGSSRGSSSSGSSSSSDRSRRFGGFSRFGGRSGGDSGGRTAMIVNMVFQRYDTNKNGVFEKSEWGGFRSDPSAADTNRDGKITRDEYTKWMEQRMSGSRWGRSRGDSRDRGRSSSSRSSDSRSASSTPQDDRRSYRMPSRGDRLPDDLPAWFTRQDSNADGQVTMSEYSRVWSDAVVQEFNLFDLNRDGIVTAKECQRAVEAGAVAGLAGQGGSPVSTSGSSSSTDSRSTSSSSSSNSKPDKYLRYAVGMIKKYDTNRDGVLTKDEWSKMKIDYSRADVDTDAKITPQELADAMRKR